MAKKIGKFMAFLRQKSVFFFAKKVFCCTPCNWGAGAHFRRPITPGLFQRGRLLGAVAQWQLRLCF